MEAKKRKVNDIELIDITTTSSTPAPKLAGEQSGVWVSDRSADIYMHVRDPTTGNLLVKPVRIQSNLSNIAKFIQKHNMVLQINGDGSYSVVPKLGQTSSPFPMVPTVTRPLFRRPRSVRPNNSGATISWQNIKPSPLRAPQRSLFPKLGFGTRYSSASETIVKLPTLGATAGITRHVPTSVNSSSTLEKAPKKEVAVEHVDVSKVERRETLWGIVAPVDLVFARRENGLFYSGHVKSQGDRPNSWKITFDNGFECSVSDSEILPIRILGAGTVVTYPAASFHIPPRFAQVVGQKIELNRALKSFSVKYAIKFRGKEQPIWARRDELCFAESTAITLRREHAFLKQGIANVTRPPVNTKKDPNQ